MPRDRERFLGFERLTASTIVDSPVPCSKTKVEVMLYYGGDVLQVRVPLCFQAEFHPVVPVFGL